MPESIQAWGTNLCLPDDPYEVETAPDPTPVARSAPQPAAAAVRTDPAEPSPSGAAIHALVSAHARAHDPDRNCATEGVALATAGVKTAVSLAAVVLTAPAEITLPVTVGRFIVDAMLLGAAAAAFVSCRDNNAPEPR